MLDLERRPHPALAPFIKTLWSAAAATTRHGCPMIPEGNRGVRHY